MFKQMYAVNEIDFENLTVDYRKIQQLEEAAQTKHDQVDGNQWTRFRKYVEVLDGEERWINYAERALPLLNHELMWQGIVEAYKILKYPEPSETHRDYFEELFDMSCFVWFQLYSETERTLSINKLIDHIIWVCKLKYNSIV